jgi:hypothetical protein
VVFRSHWAVLIDTAGDTVRPTFSTTLAPDVTEDLADQFGPFDTTHRVELKSGWAPGWGECTVVVTPLTRDRVIVVGRLGGPAFLDSEITRLNHLAALIK